MPSPSKSPSAGRERLTLLSGEIPVFILNVQVSLLSHAKVCESSFNESFPSVATTLEPDGKVKKLILKSVNRGVTELSVVAKLARYCMYLLSANAEISPPLLTSVSQVQLTSGTAVSPAPISMVKVVFVGNTVVNAIVVKPS